MPTIFRPSNSSTMLLAGLSLTLTVSLATAAIVMWLPDSPVQLTYSGSNQFARDLRQSVPMQANTTPIVQRYLFPRIETFAR